MKLLAALSLMAFAAHAGTERVDLSPTVNVLIFSTPKPGQWHSRIGKLHAFADATIYACF